MSAIVRYEMRVPETPSALPQPFLENERHRTGPALLSGDRYLVLLSGLLLGYALIGKGFAYLGFGPLFVGEITFLTGLVVFFRTGCFFAPLATLPSILLVATMAWVLLRTLPFIDEYGLDALRDSVIVMYGGFTIIVIALLVEDSRRIKTLLRYYGLFLALFIPTIPFVYAVTFFLSDQVPKLPGYGVPILEVRSGEVSVHLVGAAVFALVGFRKATWLWLIPLLVTLAMVVTMSRGAMLAFFLPVLFAALMLGKLRQIATVLVSGAVILGAAYTLETTMFDQKEEMHSNDRAFSTRQIVKNAESVVGYSDRSLEGTKSWRIDWWTIIVNDTVYGPNFWTGRGFGLNLAYADGFMHVKDPDAPALRSPHNAQLTILARAGVPGLVLWSLLLTSWLGMMLNAILTAQRRGQRDWAGLFLFVACYGLAIIIDASFDVALEGPMLGIWFWCMIGFGIGSVMTYRAQDFHAYATR